MPAPTASRKTRKTVQRKNSGLVNLVGLLQELLPTLSKEVVSDLKELFGLFEEAEDKQTRVEIAQAIGELLNPEQLAECESDGLEISLDGSNAARKRVDSYRQSVGKEIKRYRSKAKMTQKELAEKASLPQSHISRIENGVHVPTYITMERIAHALDVCPSKLDPGFPPED